MPGRNQFIFLVIACLVAVTVTPLAAQTSTFVTDYYKASGYTNVPATGAVEPVTSPKKLFEVVVTPFWPNFVLCVWTEQEPAEGALDQAGIYAKKMKWEATGVPSGERLGKGTVKTKEGLVGCKDATGFQSLSAAAAGDTEILWTVQFVMKGNRDFEGYFSPAYWSFPFFDTAGGEESFRQSEALMSQENFQAMRRQLLTTRRAKPGPQAIDRPE